VQNHDQHQLQQVFFCLNLIFKKTNPTVDPTADPSPTPTPTGILLLELNI
jgi:hypothetical protein